MVNNVYGYYAPENPEMRIEIGIKGDKLVYLCYQTPDYQIRTDYTDFDKTVIDGYSHNDFVPGITLDHNGNLI